MTFQGRVLIPLPQSTTSITVNQTFVSKYVYYICPYNANTTLKSIIWDCNGSSAAFALMPILEYCSSDLNTPGQVCGIPQLTAINCPNLIVNLSCSALISAAKFQELATGVGVISVQGTSANTSSGSDMSLLYLLFLLLLIPMCIILAAWLWWKHRQEEEVLPPQAVWGTLYEPHHAVQWEGGPPPTPVFYAVNAPLPPLLNEGAATQPFPVYQFGATAPWWMPNVATGHEPQEYPLEPASTPILWPESRFP